MPVAVSAISILRPRTEISREIPRSCFADEWCASEWIAESFPSACVTQDQDDKPVPISDNVGPKVEVRMGKPVERLPYQGESASDRLAYEKYLDDVKRGKSLMQLMAAKKATTPQIRNRWSPRSFTAVHTPQGIFDDVICNISYHFNKHGAKYGTVAGMTQAAQQYFMQNRHQAVLSSGLLRLPGGVFESDGRIITFY